MSDACEASGESSAVSTASVEGISLPCWPPHLFCFCLISCPLFIACLALFLFRFRCLFVFLCHRDFYFCLFVLAPRTQSSLCQPFRPGLCRPGLPSFVSRPSLSTLHSSRNRITFCARPFRTPFYLPFFKPFLLFPLSLRRFRRLAMLLQVFLIEVVALRLLLVSGSAFIYKPHVTRSPQGNIRSKQIPVGHLRSLKVTTVQTRSLQFCQNCYYAANVSLVLLLFLPPA